MSGNRKDVLEPVFSIPEQFFKENPIPEMCMGRIQMFEMDILFNKQLYGYRLSSAKHEM